MLKNISLLLILSTTLFFACEDPLQKEREQLYQEVMAIHDEVMPKMSSIRKGQKDLKAMIKNVEEPTDPAKIKEYKAALEQLNTASQVMIDWMKQFSTPTVEIPNEEAIQYLKEQKKSVTIMRDAMLKNMNAARKVIEF